MVRMPKVMISQKGFAPLKKFIIILDQNYYKYTILLNIYALLNMFQI